MMKEDKSLCEEESRNNAFEAHSGLHDTIDKLKEQKAELLEACKLAIDCLVIESDAHTESTAIASCAQAIKNAEGNDD